MKKMQKGLLLAEGLVHSDGERGTMMVGNHYMTTDFAFNKKILGKKIRLIAEVLK